MVLYRECLNSGKDFEEELPFTKSEKDLEKVPFQSLLFDFGPTEKTKHSYEQAKKEEEMKYQNRKKSPYPSTKYPTIQMRRTINAVGASFFGPDSKEAHTYPKWMTQEPGSSRKWRNKKKSQRRFHQEFHKKRGKKPWKVDKFAEQKRLLKQWGRVDRKKYNTYLEYIQADFKLSKLYKGNRLSQSTSLKIQGKPKTVKMQRVNIPTFHTGVLGGLADNFALQHYVKKVKSSEKQALSLYDKVFYYYTLQTPLTMYAHKAFILLEMQLNATLVRTKLVPYLFMVKDLCFYRLVQINNQVVKNPHQVVSLYDAVSLPVYLHNYMYYRQYRIQYYPQNIGVFFKKYWAHFTNYTNNKVWLLSNFITSDVTAEAVIFDYPNITLYMGPFKRFTKLYYKNHPYAPTGKHRHLNYTHTVLKLKLFEYAAFYR